VSAQPGAVPSPAPPPQQGGPGAEDRSASEIRRDIELARGQLSGSLDSLRNRVTELTDWRRQLREHRSELMVGAAIAGFVVGGIVALRRRRS
jgi:Protein of unknown function (DUF3618)